MGVEALARVAMELFVEWLQLAPPALDFGFHLARTLRHIAVFIVAVGLLVWPLQIAAIAAGAFAVLDPEAVRKDPASVNGSVTTPDSNWKKTARDAALH